ncbi:MAG: ferredoxin 4Fe-4S [Streblomastix strix]|uniref:Ferredoxin 4Fe-4S n=1 Tax=Streblomastix strix TaxID=222440 RepID=A0A5J4UPJ5_9EUKA|nr:MAG: ferredoxin 4Fe-4S [Streblomastix strix]
MAASGRIYNRYNKNIVDIKPLPPSALVSDIFECVIVFFSSTNNTRYVAQHITSALKAQTHVIGAKIDVHTYDGFELFKQADLGAPGDFPPVVNLTQNQNWQQFFTSLRTAQLFGVGCYVYAMQIPPHILRFFHKSIISDQDLKSIKYFFTFATHGSLPNPATNQLTHHLQQRLKSIFCGSIDIRCPENVPPLLPRKTQQKDLWDRQQIIKLCTFENDLLKRIQSFSYKGEKRRTFSDISFIQRVIHSALGKVTIDIDKCQSCGNCERVCPYNAIYLRKNGLNVRILEIDESRCQRCARCYNYCAYEAIQFKSWDTQLRVRYRGPEFKTKYSLESGQEEFDIREQPLVDVGKLPSIPAIFSRISIGKSRYVYLLIILSIIIYIIYQYNLTENYD